MHPEPQHPHDGKQTMQDLTRALAGAQDELGALLLRYGVRIRAAIIATGVRYDDVDAVVSDVMTKVLEALRKDPPPRWENVKAFRAWVHRIACNAAVDHLRRRGKEPRHLESMLGGGTDSVPPAERLAGREATPSVHARAHEERQRLEQMRQARFERLAGLKELDQALVAMREQLGMSWAEIANELGRIVGELLSNDAIRMRYSKLLPRIGDPLPPE